MNELYFVEWIHNYYWEDEGRQGKRTTEINLFVQVNSGSWRHKFKHVFFSLSYVPIKYTDFHLIFILCLQNTFSAWFYGKQSKIAVFWIPMTAYLITTLSIIYSSKNHINKVLTYINKMYINNVKQGWFNIQKLKLFTILTGLKKKNHDSLNIHIKNFWWNNTHSRFKK